MLHYKLLNVFNVQVNYLLFTRWLHHLIFNHLLLLLLLLLLLVVVVLVLVLLVVSVLINSK